MNMIFNKQTYGNTSFGTNFTRRAIMPIKKGMGSVKIRELMTKELADKFYESVIIKSSSGQPDIQAVKEALKRAMPGLNIKVKKINPEKECEQFSILKNMFSKVKGYKMNLSENFSMEKLMYEVTQILKTAFNPKYGAQPKLSPSVKASADSIYKAHIFNQNGNDLTMAEIKNNYKSALDSIQGITQNEKLAIIKGHVRGLELEQQAHKCETYYHFKNISGKRMNGVNSTDYKELKKLDKEISSEKDCYKETLKSNFQFTEKINFLKGLFFDELKAARTELNK